MVEVIFDTMFLQKCMFDKCVLVEIEK